MSTDIAKNLETISKTMESLFGPGSEIRKTMMSVNPQSLVMVTDHLRELMQAVRKAYTVSPEVYEALRKSLEALRIRDPYAQYLRDTASFRVDISGLQETLNATSRLTDLDLSSQDTVEVSEDTIEAIDQNIIEFPKSLVIPVGHKKVKVPISLIGWLISTLIALYAVVSDQTSQKQVQQYLEAIYQCLPPGDAEGTALPDEYQAEIASESAAEEYLTDDEPIPV